MAAAEVSRAPSGTRPPFLIAMSCATGGHAGGTSVWLQGSQFTAQTRVYVGGLPYEVTGRYNDIKESVYLRGANDESIIFRGTVSGTRVDGKARLGAGKIYEAWQLRKR